MKRGQQLPPTKAKNCYPTTTQAARQSYHSRPGLEKGYHNEH